MSVVTLPVVGREYTDRHNFTITVTAVEKSGGGRSFGGNQRKGKLTGYTVTATHGGREHKMALRDFELRGFK